MGTSGMRRHCGYVLFSWPVNAARTLLVMRLMTASPKLLKLLRACATVWRTIVLFLVATFLVTYTYAVIGVFAFPKLQNGVAQHVDMSDFGEGMLQLFQHITTNNWNSILFPNLYQCARTRR